MVEKTETIKETKKHWGFNEIEHHFSDGSVTRTFHTDVADNIYLPDKTVICLFRGETVTAKNRLALCVEIGARVLVSEKPHTKKEVAIAAMKASAKQNNGVPELADFGLDKVSRHSVDFLNDLHVTSVKGLPVCNKKK